MTIARSVQSLMMFIFVLAGVCCVASAQGQGLFDAPEQHGIIAVTPIKRYTLTFPNIVTAVAWSEKGTTLAIASSYSLVLNTYDNSGKPLTQFQVESNKVGSVSSLAFVNGASQILFPVQGNAEENAALDVRDVRKGMIVKTITRTPEENFIPNATFHYVVSPDQKLAAMAPNMGKEVVIYGTDGNDWHEVSVLKMPPGYGAVSLCFFPDGSKIAVGENMGHFLVADTATGAIIKEYHTYDEHYGNIGIEALAINPSQDFILSAMGEGVISDVYINAPSAKNWERSYDRVTVWGLRDGVRLYSFPDSGKRIVQAVWDPQGRFVAFVDSDSLVFLHPGGSADEPNYVRIKFPYSMAGLALTEDGKMLAVAGGNNVTVYDIENH